MSQRQQLSRRFSLTARSAPSPDGRRGDTLPGGPRILEPPDEPTLLGLPAELEPDPDTDGAEESADAGPDWVAAEDRLVVRNRPDAFAGSLLMIAGAAGGMSLFLPWVGYDGALGISLVRAGADVAGSGILPLADSGLVLPLGVAVSGGALFLLGLLAFRPARTHRASGTAALFVVLAVAAGVLVEVANAGWDAVGTDPGPVCAVLLAGFGALGALKAMLTAPDVTTDPD